MIEETSVTEFYEAALMQYLGYLCISCRVSGQEATFTFRGVKEFDAQIVKEEFANPETSVLLQGFIRSMNEVASFRNAARRSLEGMWRSTRYAERRVGRI